MNRKAAIEAATNAVRQRLDDEGISALFLSESSVSQMCVEVATAAIDAAEPHLVGEPVGYQVGSPAIGMMTLEAANEHRHACREDKYPIVALIPVEES